MKSTTLKLEDSPILTGKTLDSYKSCSSNGKNHPRATANFFSKLFFWWMTALIKLGYRREIQSEDLYGVLPEDEAEHLGQTLEKEWIREQNRSETSGSEKSLAKAAFRTFGLKFLIISMIVLIDQCVLKVFLPLILGELILYFEPESSKSTEMACLYGAGIALYFFSYVITENWYWFESKRTGIQLRTACCSLIFKQCLKLSQNALSNQTSIGHVTNLMSNDVNRFENAASFVPFMWISPLQMVIVTFILYWNIGPSSLVGVFLIILLVPLQACTGKVFSSLRGRVAKQTDQRVKTMNEFIAGIQVIKLYAWEKPFANLIEHCRRMEVKTIRSSAYFNALVYSIFFISVKLNIFSSLTTYLLLGNYFTPQKVFLTISLFNNVRLGMGLYFYRSIFYFAESLVSLKRIQAFLSLEEMKIPLENNYSKSINEPSIVCNGASVNWLIPTSSEPFKDSNDKMVLKNVSFTVEPGELLAIVGQVGSGKSLLLNMLLGELVPLKGTCEVKGRLAYSSQDPWIFSGTVRQNILCGLAYDPIRYHQVVQATELEQDFRQFPNGDGVQVGEKGISLSGGQKARISLARCLYVDADIYLLDDPLSAVDVQVGRNIFENAIDGFLRGKIRILVTHQLQYLKAFDQIIVLGKGFAQGIGNFEELCSKGLLNQITKSSSHNKSESPGTDSLDSLEHHNYKYKDLSSAAAAAPLEETREIGTIPLSIYWKYIGSGGGYFFTSLFVITFLIAIAFEQGCNYWLSLWTEKQTRISAYNASSSKYQIVDFGTMTGIQIYSGLMGGCFIFIAMGTIQFFYICTKSSKVLHQNMFSAILRSPMSFFDQNPVGRILNRFSKDIGCMDETLPTTFFDTVEISFNVLGVFAVTTSINIWFLPPAILLVIFCCLVRRVYIRASLSLRRLEAISRSPIFSHVSDLMIGLTTLRAHRLQISCEKEFYIHQDANNAAYYLFQASIQWFSCLVNLSVALYISCVTFTCIALRGTLSSSEAGLFLSTVFYFTSFAFGIFQSTETENLMSSVQRVIEYGQLPSEAPLESASDKKPPSDWPSKGKICFDHVYLKYGKCNEPVLKNICCTIIPKEKVGIIGRTGAGKSSLITALFRLSEPEGKIFIDEIDTKDIGLHDLRSKISIIPQDPFLFSGTLRRNLDPFGHYEDDVLSNVLQQVQLKESVEDSNFSLDYMVTGGGANLSVGQRQLVCLARAILRQNRILVLDEATANVDQKTDKLIQQTIREKFKDCTVLTIAHRLNTIIDSDKIMIMDNGILTEFGNPAILLKNHNSRFFCLFNQAGYLPKFET